MAPASARPYLEYALDPSSRPLRDLDELVERAPRGPELLSRARAALEDGFRILDRPAFERDVQPWLGDRAGTFFTSFDDEETAGAFAVEIEDRDAAESFLVRSLDQETPNREAAGSEYRLGPDGNAATLVGDLLLFGTEATVREALGVAAGDAGPLAEEQAYRFAALAAFAAPFVDPADREVIADLASVSAATGTRSTGGRIVLRMVLALNSEAPG